MTGCVNCGEPIRRTVQATDHIDPRDSAWVHEDGNLVCDIMLVASPGGDGNGPAPRREDAGAYETAVADILTVFDDDPLMTEEILAEDDDQRTAQSAALARIREIGRAAVAGRRTDTVTLPGDTPDGDR